MSLFLVMYFLSYLFPIFRYIALGSQFPQQMLACGRFYSIICAQCECYIWLIWRFYCFGKFFQYKSLVCCQWLSVKNTWIVINNFFKKFMLHWMQSPWYTIQRIQSPDCIVTWYRQMHWRQNPHVRGNEVCWTMKSWTVS